MSILGVIAEYNPFHFGHEYHINKSKEEIGASFVVSVMSGSFVQRGEPAFMDKWSRARMALEGGVDLVIELPTAYATQTAESFAYGAVKLLDSLNIIDYISFGTETGELENLKIISDILVEEPMGFRNPLKEYLNRGFSFPVARGMALDHCLANNIRASEIISRPNNILAIEYLKALSLLDSKIKPYTIKRAGEDYSSKKLHVNFTSATGIRENIRISGINSVKNYLPEKSFKIIKNFFNEFQAFNSLNNYQDILLYLLRTIKKEDMNNLMDVEYGLGNRILNNASKFHSLDEIIESSISKSHTRTRVQRVLTHLLLGLDKETISYIEKSYPSHIRVLASNEKGLELLNKIGRHSNIPIVTKFANYKNLASNSVNQAIELDKKATDIFYLGLPNKKMNMDFLTSPYIKK